MKEFLGLVLPVALIIFVACGETKEPSAPARELSVAPTATPEASTPTPKPALRAVGDPERGKRLMERRQKVMAA